MASTQQNLYDQVSRYAARLMVVHEAGRILRSTTDARELSARLLKVITEPLFSSSGCVARLQQDELSILAHTGLTDEEADGLVAGADEAAVWFTVADSDKGRTRAELQQSVRWPKREDTAGAEATPTPAFDLYVPLRAEQQVLGVLAVGRRVDGESYTSDDLAFLETLSYHLALALDHASLLADKARRIDQLSVLLKISREITSTLDLDRVLATIAQMVSMVVPNRRTTVALATGDKVDIRASSDPAFNPKAARTDPLFDALRWVHGAGQRVNTSVRELEWNESAPGRDVLQKVLNADNGPRGIAILPLSDDQGVLGLLAIESNDDAGPLNPEHDELVTILANQTTVAIRNAELYSRVPMVGMFDSILGKSGPVSKFRKRLVTLTVAAVLLAVGLLVPLPAWVSGSAGVRPAVPVAVRAATAGILSEVHVLEGQKVEAGKVLGTLRRDELEVERQRIDAALQRAQAQAAGARSQGDLATYSSLQAEQRKLREELRFLDTELTRTNLTAPVSGVVLTPWVELRTGERLGRGDTFLELADLSTMEIEVGVPEEDIDGIANGAAGRLKVHSYPRQKFTGEVVRVAPKAGEDGLFRVILSVDNPDGILRPGMSGSAHIDIPSRPVLRWLARPFLRWLRVKLWV